MSKLTSRVCRRRTTQGLSPARITTRRGCRAFAACAASSALLGLLTAPAADAACTPSPPDAGGVIVVTCDFTGDEQTFTVPATSALQIVATGGTTDLARCGHGERHARRRNGPACRTRKRAVRRGRRDGPRDPQHRRGVQRRRLRRRRLGRRRRRWWRVGCPDVRAACLRRDRRSRDRPAADRRRRSRRRQRVGLRRVGRRSQSGVTGNSVSGTAGGGGATATAGGDRGSRGRQRRVRRHRRERR